MEVQRLEHREVEWEEMGWEEEVGMEEGYLAPLF
jgi:hypothetical protein